MEGVRDRTFAYARSRPLDLPGVLGAHVRDWHIVDSSTVKLDRRLQAEYPGTGDYAALKVHKRFSIGLGTLWDYHLSPAREHDAPHLVVDETWRGLGLLVDLGYASHRLLRDCQQHGVKFVIRLKEGWKPKVEEIHRGELARTFLKGTDLDALVEDGILKLAGRSIDLDVVLGRGPGAVRCRLVGVRGPDSKGWCWYLTNLPRTVTPAQILDLYRVRWEIESDNKLDKSCLRLDEIKARSGAAVRALVHAAMVSATLVCLVAHHHRLREAPPPRPGAERTKPPIHPQMMARQIGISAMRIAAALDLRGQRAAEEWEFIAGLLVHQGTDPNWRRRPSAPTLARLDPALLARTEPAGEGEAGGVSGRGAGSARRWKPVRARRWASPGPSWMTSRLRTTGHPGNQTPPSSASCKASLPQWLPVASAFVALPSLSALRPAVLRLPVVLPRTRLLQPPVLLGGAPGEYPAGSAALPAQSRGPG